MPTECSTIVSVNQHSVLNIFTVCRWPLSKLIILKGILTLWTNEQPTTKVRVPYTIFTAKKSHICEIISMQSICIWFFTRETSLPSVSIVVFYFAHTKRTNNSYEVGAVLFVFFFVNKELWLPSKCWICDFGWRGNMDWK